MTRAKERSFSDDQPSSASTATAPVSAFAFGARSGESNPNVLPCIDRHRHTRVVGGGKHNSVLSSSSVANDSTLAARGSVDSAPRAGPSVCRSETSHDASSTASVRTRLFDGVPNRPLGGALTHPPRAPSPRRIAPRPPFPRAFPYPQSSATLRRASFPTVSTRIFTGSTATIPPPPSVCASASADARLSSASSSSRETRARERGEERSFASTSRIVSPPSTAGEPVT